MKKLIAGILLIMLVVVMLPAGGLAAKNKTFTLMIYLCGTDLESDGGMATSDLTEMASVGIDKNSDLTVCIQTGGTKNWQADGITDRQVQRWVLGNNSIELEENVGRADMGKTDTLSDFIQATMLNHKADRYGLILWDHGSGSTGGVCYDEMSNDALFMDEIASALQEVSKAKNYKKFAFIGFDACLMASYEMANTLAPFSEYMIASEELEPGTGWGYDRWLPALANDPDINIETLGAKIVDTFISSAVSYNSTEYATLSVIDLGKMEALRNAVESMSVSLNEQLSGGNLTSISRIRQNLRSFGEVSSDTASDMIDLTVFSDAYSKFDKTNAKKIKTALKNAVVYSKHTNNVSNISGMSILVPYATRMLATQYLGSYDTLEQSPNYKAFVSSMIGQMSSGSYTFSSANVQQQSVQDAQIDWFSQYASDPDDYYSTYESLYSDQSSSDSDDFSLDSFLSALFGEGSQSDNTLTDGSSLWCDMDDDADTSFITNYSLSGESIGADSTSSTVDVQTSEGTVSLDNPFSGAQGDYAYTVTLSDEDIQYLAKAEANLMMDISDDDGEYYVELGYTNDVFIDWDKGVVYSLFDGTWPCVDGQLVCMYTQVSNEQYIRALAPVLVNDVEQYLLIVFDEDHPDGTVIGYTEGYTDNGTPARGYTKLKKGDVITPAYELLYWDENGDQQSEPFYGDPVTAGKDGALTFGYESLADESAEETNYVYGFLLTDIFGDEQFTDFQSITF